MNLSFITSRPGCLTSLVKPTFFKIVRDIVIASVYPSKRSFVQSGSALFVDVSYTAIVGQPDVTLMRERSGSVVERLTRDRRAAGSSLTGVTALCP